MNPTISAADFTHLLKAGTAPHVIDVRRPDEYAEVHVQSARLFPLDDLQPGVVAQAIGAHAAEPIYILCKSGMRAGKAADRFRAAGITNICVVEGGTEACVAAGAPLKRL